MNVALNLPLWILAVPRVRNFSFLQFFILCVNTKLYFTHFIAFKVSGDNVVYLR